MTRRLSWPLFACLLVCLWTGEGFGAGGWYLLLPPGTFDDSDPANPVFQMDNTVPMSRWRHLGSYDSAKECEKGKAEEVRSVTVLPVTAKGGEVTKLHLWLRTGEARCIMSDDPRLK